MDESLDVSFLRSGFDPAYVLIPQERLNEGELKKEKETHLE